MCVGDFQDASSVGPTAVSDFETRRPHASEIRTKGIEKLGNLEFVLT